ncbi:efflux RND transporter periplasmic adaptor subunit [Pirellulaceae bacterium SH467]
MNSYSIRSILRSPALRWGVGILLLVVGAWTFPRWWPGLNAWIDNTVAARKESVPKKSDADGHQEENSASGESNSIELTPQSLKNLGLTDEYLQPVKLSNFYRTITIPAMVIAKPGRTEIQVSSPMVGIVQHVHAVSGEAVEPGETLFKIRLTYEELVDTQTQFLKNHADLAVEQREIARLEEVTRSGAVASKLLLERQYAFQKLQSTIAAQQAALRLHGLSDEQINTIIRENRLLRDLTIVAPEIDDHPHEENPLRLSDRRILTASFPTSIQPTRSSAESIPLIVERLSVSKGQGVQAGEMLCTLSDYSSLYVEGKAFEQDAPAIAEVAANGWPVEAIFPGVDGQETVSGLNLAFVANAVDSQSRTLSFFVDLPNTKLRDEDSAEGQRFVTWKYRVGQRLEVRVPTEAWEGQIVLPVDAAVKDGADWFVFQQNGDHFDRVSVHVKHRDQRNVVIENDGSIYPGDIIAMRSAHQMQMAMKNKSGSAVDPHAGHNH